MKFHELWSVEEASDEAAEAVQSWTHMDEPAAAVWQARAVVGCGGIGLLRRPACVRRTNTRNDARRPAETAFGLGQNAGLDLGGENGEAGDDAAQALLDADGDCGCKDWAEKPIADGRAELLQDVEEAGDGGAECVGHCGCGGYRNCGWSFKGKFPNFSPFGVAKLGLYKPVRHDRLVTKINVQRLLKIWCSLRSGSQHKPDGCAKMLDYLKDNGEPDPVFALSRISLEESGE